MAGTRVNFTHDQAIALYVAVLFVIDGCATSPELDRALDKLERTDRPTFTVEELGALLAEAYEGYDDYDGIPAHLNTAIDKLEAAR